MPAVVAPIAGEAEVGVAGQLADAFARVRFDDERVLGVADEEAEPCVRAGGGAVDGFDVVVVGEESVGRAVESVGAVVVGGEDGEGEAAAAGWVGVHVVGAGLGAWLTIPDVKGPETREVRDFIAYSPCRPPAMRTSFLAVRV